MFDKKLEARIAKLEKLFNIKNESKDRLTVGELIEKLKAVNPNTIIFIEGRDSTGEYEDAYEMTDKHLHIGDERIVIVTD